MSEYEKVMNVLFDRGLPSETCGRVANMYSQLAKVEKENAELKLQLEEALKLSEEAINDIIIDFCNNSEEIVKEYNLRLKKLKDQGE